MSNNTDIKKELNDLLMSDEATKLLVRSLTSWVIEQEIYGGCFHRLQIPEQLKIDDRKAKEMLWDLTDEEHIGGN